MTIEQAIEVFVRGFCFTRSFTHPYLAEQVDGLWMMRDASRRSGDYRSEEFVSYGLPPTQVDDIARRNTRGGYRLCVMRAAGEPDAAIRADFRALRYRLRGTEAFMAHDLERIPNVEPPLPIVRVATQNQADHLNKVAGRRQVLPEHLQSDPAPIRQYMAVDGEMPIAWLQSVAAGDSTWCSSMFVQPNYRRRGIARSLLARMLSDDRASGATASVLLASHAGSHLYPVVGYETLGELMVYCPPRRD